MFSPSLFLPSYSFVLLARQMASIASSSRTSPIYDQIHIEHSKHVDKGGEYVDVDNDYQGGPYGADYTDNEVR